MSFGKFHKLKPSKHIGVNGPSSITIEEWERRRQGLLAKSNRTNEASSTVRNRRLAQLGKLTLADTLLK